MKKLCYLLLLLLVGQLSVQAQPPRKKVGVVLSGGGAKGMAHIGALKVIEEAGIPIDYIVGTSMGSIIGGLYAIGYTPQQMDSIVTRQDWTFLLTDAVDRKEQLLIKKQNAEKYTLSVPFKNTPKDALKGGVIAGRNIAHLFSKLTEGYHDSIDFDQLPIPFACVATDIVDGSEYVFRQGKLALAMRSSMSIPGVFEPVHWNGKVLVDGGMTNNYPVDVAKQMGADIIVGVDVQDHLASADKLNTVPEVLGQLINIICSNKYTHNAANSDVLVKVDVKGYSAGSFNHTAIDSLMARGQRAAMAQWDSLIALKQKIGIPKNYVPKPHGPFTAKNPDTKVVPEIDPGAMPDNSIGVGVRFDNESLAALILNTYINLNKKKSHQASLTVRLGQQTFGNIGYTFKPFTPAWSLSLNYQLKYNDLELYQDGSKFCSYSYINNRGEISIARSWNNILFSIGGRYEYYNYNDLLLPADYENEMVLKNQHLITYYGQMQFDSYDRRTYPTKGMKWNLGAALYTDNGIQYNNRQMVPAVYAFWEGVFRMTNRFSLLPWIGGRTLLADDYSFTIANLVGGNSQRRFEEFQLPFVGIDYMQLTGSKTFTGGIRFRQRMGSNHYVSGTFNAGVHHDEWSQLFDHPMWGGGATYGYDTFLGPLEITFNYSNVTKKIGTYISLGYNF